jgi:hypothetical protein
MKKILLASLLLAAPLAHAVDVKVTEVADRRSSGSFAQFMIELQIPSVKSTDVAASRVIVSAATDDKGTNLVDAESQPSLDANMRPDASRPASVSMTLKNPSRKATRVTEIRGEIELYMPGKDPNSTADIAKFTSLAGKPLAHKALKANGVEIALISPAQIAAEKKKLGDAKRVEVKDYGYDAETLESVVSSYVDSALRVEESDVLLRIKDPNKRIQDISYVDAAGEAKHVSRSDNEQGFTVLSTWGEKPQADWKMRIAMRTPKNLVRQPFTIKDVPLP